LFFGQQFGDQQQPWKLEFGRNDCLKKNPDGAFIAARKINVSRIYCGSLMTSLEMAGFSITLIKLDQPSC
jgi:hypothetical protein